MRLGLKIFFSSVCVQRTTAINHLASYYAVHLWHANFTRSYVRIIFVLIRSVIFLQPKPESKKERKKRVKKSIMFECKKYDTCDTFSMCRLKSMKSPSARLSILSISMYYLQNIDNLTSSFHNVYSHLIPKPIKESNSTQPYT